MKLILMLLGLVAVAFCGYLFEPSLRPQLTGLTHKRTLRQSSKPAEGLPDPSSLSPEQLPEKVTLRADVTVTDAASQVTMTLQSGNCVKLVRVEGTNAVVSPGEGSYEGTLPYDQTDLMDQLAALQPAPETPATEPAPSNETPPASEPASSNETPPATEPATEPAAEPAPATEPAMEPAPASETPPATEPAAEPASKPAAAAGEPVDVVALMQQSIRKGEIKEFTYTQVEDWKTGDNETVKGEEFQTGLISYTADTIFGPKAIEAKALVKDGKIQRWIWTKSGMEIK